MIWGPEQTTASVVAVMLNVLVGAGWVICFARFIKAQDDLWRKIMQDALAVTLGSGWVAGFGVSRQSVNAIETGKFDPSLPVAFRLALLFELPIEDIFSFEPTP